MSIYSDYANNLSRIYEQRGQALADAARAKGQIWAGALAQLGNIPAAFQQQQDLNQQRQIRGLQLQTGQLELTEKQRDMAAQDALNTAISKSLKPDGSIDLDTLGQSVANTPAAAKFPEMVQHFTAAQKAKTDLLEAQQKVAKAEADHVGAIAAGADVYEDPKDKAEALLAGIASGVKDGTIAPAHGQAIVGRLMGPDGQPDPAAVKQIIGQMKAASKEQSELANQSLTAQSRALSANTGAQRLEMEAPGLAAQATLRQQQATGTVPMTPYQQQEVALGQGRLAVEKQREARESATATAAPVQIKPGTPEYRIAQDLANGKMTFSQFRTLAAYNRNAALKFGIYDTARQLNPEFDPAQYELGFKMASNPQIRQRIVAINALAPVIDQAEALAGQVGNTDIPAFNKLLQSAKFNVGNREVTNFRQLQTLLGDEVGNALGVGTGSDLKTRLGLDLVNPNLGPAQFAATMQQLRSVLDARRAELTRQMGIYGSAAQPAAAPPATAPGPNPFR